MSLLRNKYVGAKPNDPMKDDPPEVEEMEEILQPEQIVFHKEKRLLGGRLPWRYLVKFCNYPTIDAKWLDEQTLKDYLQLLDACLEAFSVALNWEMSP